VPISLTFDDGPHPDWTPDVLKALKRANVLATFFVVGELADRHSEIVREALADGHSIQPHCWSHAKSYRDMVSFEEIDADITRVLEVLDGLQVPRPRLWRPIGGDPHPVHSAPVAAKHDLQLTYWEVDVRDFDPDQTTEAMLDQLRTGKPQPGYDQPKPLTDNSAVLMHDGRLNTARLTAENTVALIGPLAELVRSRGWAFALM